MERVRFPKWQVRDDDFMFVSSEYPGTRFLLATTINRGLAEILNSHFCGRRSTWGVPRVILFALRVVTLYMFYGLSTRFIFAWQAQYLVKL